MRNSRTLLYFIIIFLVLCFIPLPVQAKQSLPQGIQKALDSISKDTGLAIISELASEKYGGRLTGTEGQLLAADYIRSAFENAGLKPFGGKNSFFQQFQLATYKIYPTPILEVKTDKLKWEKYEFGTNFICRGFSGSGDITAEVVFCGYGISNDKFDEYANVDVKGKIVLIISGHPRKYPELYDWNPIGKKANNAIKHGAAGLLIIPSSPDGTYHKPECSAIWGDFPYQPQFPMMVIDHHVALDIMKPTKLDLPVLESLINSENKPMSLATGSVVHMKVEAEFIPLANTANVVGLLEGSDPRLKNEYIVIGAHMDHMGTQGADIIFPGDNDNASGIAGIISIAKAFQKAGIKPKRSIIFVAFTGEEMGLKGSQYFVDHLPVDKKKIKGMINLDMIGQGKGKILCFGKEFPKMVKTAQKANKALYNLEMPIIETGWNSDHVSFKKAGIPAIMFLNGGEYDYPYHHKHHHYREWMTNTEMWKKTTDTAFLTLWFLAN